MDTPGFRPRSRALLMVGTTRPSASLASVIGAAASALLLSSCTAAPSGEDAPSSDAARVTSSASSSAGAPPSGTTAASAGLLSERWSWPGTPVSDVSTEGDRVLFYALGSDRIQQLVALDAQSGEVAWTKGRIARTTGPTQEAFVTPEMVGSPVVIDGVVYFAQESARKAFRDFVIGVDLETGEQVVRTRKSPGPVGGVYACTRGEDRVPCFDAWDDDGRQTYELRPDGSWKPWRSTHDYASIESGNLEFHDGGSVRLSVPMTDLVGAKVARGQYVKSVLLTREGGRQVAVVSIQPVAPKHVGEDGTIRRVDYGRAMTLGVDAQTGERLWIRRGVGYCPGDVAQQLDPADEDSPPAVLKCAVTGSSWALPYRPNVPLSATLSDDFAVELMRLDPQTGKTLWSVPLGSSPMIAQEPQVTPGETTVMIASETERAFAVTEDGTTTLTVVDLVTGDQRKATEGDRFVCWQPERTRTRSPWYVDDVPDTTLLNWSVYPCSWPGQKAVDGDFGEVLASSDPEDEDALYVVDPEGVSAYDWQEPEPSASP